MIQATRPTCLAAIYAVSLAAPLNAEPWSCAFTASCPAGFDCQEASLQLEITNFDHEGNLFFVGDGAGQAVQRLSTRDAPHRSYGGETAFLTIAADGRATYSVHSQTAAPTTTYFGTCEEL